MCPAKVMVSPPWEPQTPTLEVECACGPLLGLPPAYPVSGVPQPGVGLLRSVNWGQGGGEEGLGQSCIWVRGCAKSAHPAGCCQARSCPFKCPSRCRDLWNQEPRASRRPGVTSATLG